MDKAQAKALGAATQAALEEVAEKFGLTVKVSGGSFDPAAGTFKPKVEYVAADSERLTFERLAPAFGVDPALYGTTFVEAGRVFTVAELNTRAQRFPLVARDESGRAFKFTDATLERIGKVSA